MTSNQLFIILAAVLLVYSTLVFLGTLKEYIAERRLDACMDDTVKRDKTVRALCRAGVDVYI